MYNTIESNIQYIESISKEKEVWHYGVNARTYYYHSLIDDSVSLIRHFGCAIDNDNSGELLCNTISKFKLIEIQNHDNDATQMSNIGFDEENYQWFAITEDIIKVFHCNWNKEQKSIKLKEAQDYLKNLNFDKKWVSVYKYD